MAYKHMDNHFYSEIKIKMDTPEGFVVKAFDQRWGFERTLSWFGSMKEAKDYIKKLRTLGCLHPTRG